MSVPLRCPRTHQALTPAKPEIFADLRARREAGTLRNFAGESPESFDAALVSADGAMCYPVRGGIPVLLAGEGMRLV